MPDSIISTQSADVTNAETNGDLNVSASSENLAAKFKYPGKSQDAGAGGSQWNTTQ